MKGEGNEKREQERWSSSPQTGRGAIRLSAAPTGAVEKRTSAGVRGQKLQGGAVITGICGRS